MSAAAPSASAAARADDAGLLATPASTQIIYCSFQTWHLLFGSLCCDKRYLISKYPRALQVVTVHTICVVQ